MHILAQLEHRFWKIQKRVQLETRISVQVARIAVQINQNTQITLITPTLSQNLPNVR